MLRFGVLHDTPHVRCLVATSRGSFIPVFRIFPAAAPLPQAEFSYRAVRLPFLFEHYVNIYRGAGFTHRVGHYRATLRLFVTLHVPRFHAAGAVHSIATVVCGSDHRCPFVTHLGSTVDLIAFTSRLP